MPIRCPTAQLVDALRLGKRGNWETLPYFYSTVGTVHLWPMRKSSPRNRPRTSQRLQGLSHQHLRHLYRCGDEVKEIELMVLLLYMYQDTHFDGGS